MNRYIPFNPASEIIYQAVGALQPTTVIYQPQQIAYAFRPEELKVGMRVRYLLDAYRTFYAHQIPTPRFMLGEIIKIYGSPNDPLMRIKNLDKTIKFISIDCGVNQYAKFCLPAYVKAKPRKHSRSPR